MPLLDDMTFLQNLKSEGYAYVRPSRDGQRWIAVHRLMYHYSLQSGRMGVDTRREAYVQRFCYPQEFDLPMMIEAADNWEGEFHVDPPHGWIKDHTRNRCRRFGLPENETIGWEI